MGTKVLNITHVYIYYKFMDYMTMDFCVLSFFSKTSHVLTIFQLVAGQLNIEYIIIDLHTHVVLII